MWLLEKISEALYDIPVGWKILASTIAFGLLPWAVVYHPMLSLLIYIIGMGLPFLT